MTVLDARNLILGGFMGTGKSAVGRIVAQRLDRPFVDTDAEIVTQAGKSIADIFEQDGESQFRMLEATLCRELAKTGGRAIAVGGGSLLDAASRRALEATGTIICLRADLDAIMRRVGDDPSRPLFGNREEVARLLAARKAHYDSFEHQIDTTGKSPEHVAEEAIALWRQAN